MSTALPGIMKETGEVAGATSATAFPAIEGYWAKIIAASDNAGKVYIGKSGVTKADGTTDTTSGWPLQAGQETPWIRLDNNTLASLYRICDNAGDDVLYMVTL